jgi:hypothetical protein
MKQPDEKFCELLRSAVGPASGAELSRDLWPDMRRRLEKPPQTVPWWDWALAALMLLCAALFPAAIPALLYQF